MFSGSRLVGTLIYKISVGVKLLTFRKRVINLALMELHQASLAKSYIIFIWILVGLPDFRFKASIRFQGRRNRLQPQQYFRITVVKGGCSTINVKGLLLLIPEIIWDTSTPLKFSFFLFESTKIRLYLTLWSPKLFCGTSQTRRIAWECSQL